LVNLLALAMSYDALLPGLLGYNQCLVIREKRHTVPTHNVNLTEELDRFILDKIHSGRYQDASEVVREALRTLEREEQKYEALRTAIDEGDSSGIAEGDVFASVRQTLKLPAKRL
jgi:antitoxin ParD1/3/4